MYTPKWSTMHKICSQFEYADNSLRRNLIILPLRLILIDFTIDSTKICQK